MKKLIRVILSYHFSRRTPYSITRFIVPWKLLRWIDENSDLCWAGIVMWKMGYGWKWKVVASCFNAIDIHEKEHRCYCMKYELTLKELKERFGEDKLHCYHRNENGNIVDLERSKK